MTNIYSKCTVKNWNFAAWTAYATLVSCYLSRIGAQAAIAGTLVPQEIPDDASAEAISKRNSRPLQRVCERCHRANDIVRPDRYVVRWACGHELCGECYACEWDKGAKCPICKGILRKDSVAFLWYTSCCSIKINSNCFIRIKYSFNISFDSKILLRSLPSIICYQFWKSIL